MSAARIPAGTLQPGVTGSVNFNNIGSGTCGMSAMFGCAWGNGRFLFLGSGASNFNLATSPIANNCASVSNSNTLFSTRGRGAVYGPTNSRWVALGEGTNSIAYSDDDATTWTGLGTSIFTVGYYVAVRE